MPEQEAETPLAGLRLDRISTHMTTLQDAERFVMRYGKAIRGYVTAILRDPAEGEEVVQELILGLLRRGGPATWPGAGRFRDYLKASARNAAVTYLRKKGRQRAAESDARRVRRSRLDRGGRGTRDDRRVAPLRARQSLARARFPRAQIARQPLLHRDEGLHGVPGRGLAAPGRDRRRANRPAAVARGVPQAGQPFAG